MENFTPISATIGGVLIGASAVLLMAFNGRIAGISGIFSGLLRFQKGEWGWRASFVAGLLLAPIAYQLFSQTPIPHGEPSPLGIMAIGGFIVGFGTTMGGGCTSGHGVCGMSRGAKRSFLAVPIFMLTGMITVYIARHGFGLGG